MTTTTETRIDIPTRAGTSLAVWSDGDGPPLVLVHGSLQDHTASRDLVDELVGDFTTFALDRRGFGASEDTASWTIDDDFADLTAVVDHVVATTGQPVAIWGHSFGANVAMGAAARTTHVAGLVLYEPSLGLTFPDGVIDALASRMAAGDREGAVAQYLSDVLGLPDDDVAAMRSTPRWAGMVSTVHTVPRESWAEQGWRDAGQFASITAPTLMLTGSDTPPDIAHATTAAADAIGRPEIKVLDGHAHLAHRTDPALVAGIVRDVLEPLHRSNP
jgi:pimeloyl-ACP methyl ester carboxylesterase